MFIHNKADFRYPFIVSQLGNVDLSIHEPIAWRLAEMIQSIGFRRDCSSCSGSNLDVELEVSLLHVGSLCFNVTTQTEPTCRPRSLKSQSLVVGLELATIEDVEVSRFDSFVKLRLTLRFLCEVMRDRIFESQLP